MPPDATRASAAARMVGAAARGGPTRRRLLQLAAGAGSAGLVPAPALAQTITEAPPQATPLGALAARAGLLWGTGCDDTILADDPRFAGGGNAFFSPHAAAYRALIAAERPTIFALGGAFKFDALYRAPPARPGGLPSDRLADGSSSYDLARTLVADHAAPARLPVRIDAMIWNLETTPGHWLGRPETFVLGDGVRERRRAGREILHAAIDASFARLKAWQAEFGYPLVHSVGVVNEPLNGYAAATLCRGPECWGNPNLLVGPDGGRTGPDLGRLIPPGPWANLLGPDFVVEAMRAATAANRGLGAKLFLNEAWCECDRIGPAQRRALLVLLRYLLDQPGVQIDAVGLECHLQPPWMNEPTIPRDAATGRASTAAWAPFVAFLREVAALVPEIYLTEFDVNDCGLAGGADFDARDRLVADYHGSFLEAVLAVPEVRMVTHWGLSDLFNGMYEVRPAAAQPGNLQGLLPPDPARGGATTCPVRTAPSGEIPGGILRPDLYGQVVERGAVVRRNAPKLARDAVRDALVRHRGRA